MRTWTAILRVAAAAACIARLLATAGAADTAACTTATVASAAGPVCGTVETTTTGHQADAFLGIPYAEAVSGDRRWTAPVPKRPWTERYDAVAFGPTCPQTIPSSPTAAPASSENEDCLSLNIWRPTGASAGSGLPVMVFIYGGAFVAGTSSDPLYDGAYLAANHGVILVSFNYRLGVLGFLATDELSGNYGFIDQQRALSWVHDNIRTFGGDPGKVTIFGESAGAMSVGLHAFSAPASAKLFRAAIMESNFLALPYKQLRDQISIGNIFKRTLNCADAACLRHVDLGPLLFAQNALQPLIATVFPGMPFYLPIAPAIDGVLLTRQPVFGGDPGKPILIGTNKNEGMIFVGGSPMSLPTYAALTASLFGPAFQRVMVRYPAIDNSDNTVTWGKIQTDDFLICSTRHLADNVLSPVYAYLFDHRPSFQVWGGPVCRTDDIVCHGAELPFVFHSAEKIGGHFTATEEALSASMMDDWTSFARALAPNGRNGSASTIHWPRFRDASRTYLAFNTPALTLQNDPYRDTCAFWDKIGYDLTNPYGSHAAADPR